MKIKACLMACLLPLLGGAQDLEFQNFFSIKGGWGILNGSLKDAPFNDLRFDPAFQFNLAWERYSRESDVVKDLVLTTELGYDFSHYALDEKELGAYFGPGSSIHLKKRLLGVHGPYFNVFLAWNRPFHPYLGLGVHLLSLRAPGFDLETVPAENFYSYQEYRSASGWGRVNPAVSAQGGFRFFFHNGWGISAGYHLYLRDSWTMRYHIKSVPASQDYEEVEGKEFITRKSLISGWKVGVMIPLGG